MCVAAAARASPSAALPRLWAPGYGNRRATGESWANHGDTWACAMDLPSHKKVVLKHLQHGTMSSGFKGHQPCQTFVTGSHPVCGKPRFEAM